MSEPEAKAGVRAGFCLAIKIPQQSKSPRAVEPRGTKDLSGWMYRQFRALQTTRQKAKVKLASASAERLNHQRWKARGGGDGGVQREQRGREGAHSGDHVSTVLTVPTGVAPTESYGGIPLPL